MNKESIVKLSTLYSMCIDKEKSLAEEAQKDAMAQQIGEMAMQGTVDAGLTDATNEIMGGEVPQDQSAQPEAEQGQNVDLSAIEQ
jgi:hypothetical protein